MLKTLTDKLRRTVPEVNSYYEGSLRSDVVDLNERRCINNNRNDCDILPALAVQGNTTIELTDLNMTKTPNFSLLHFEVVLEKFFIKICLELKELSIEGKYNYYSNDVNSPAIDDKGNIMFIIKDAILDGYIPIQVDQDSITSKTFCLDFKPTEIVIKKSSDKGGKVESTEIIAKDYAENVLFKSFIPSFFENMFYILQRDIGGSICEYSLSEAFADEPEDIICHSEYMVYVANRLMDNILNATCKVEGKFMPVQDFNLVFKEDKFDSPSILQLTDGTLGDLLRWKRTDEASVYEVDGVYYHEAVIKMVEFSLTYKKCIAKRNNVQNEGSLTLTSDRPRFHFKSSVRKIGETYVTTLEHIKFHSLLDIDVNAESLDCLSDMRDRYIKWLKSFFVSEISGKLNDAMTELFQEACKKIQIETLIPKCP